MRRFWTSPTHPPLAHPGIYAIIHLATGRRYIGLSKDIHHRLRRHALGHGDSPEIKAAIREYGPEAFAAEALYYSLTGPDDLPEIEAQMIERFDSIRHGFNIQARSGCGPRGEAFARKLREGQARPEVRAATLRRANDPDQRAKRGAAIRAAYDDPELRERHRRSVMAAQREPAFKARMRKLYDSPEYRAKLRAIHAGRSKAVSSRMRKWHADPLAKERHRAAVQAKCTPERNAAIAASKRGKIFITDGTTSRLHPQETPLPPGWQKGRVKYSK